MIDTGDFGKLTSVSLTSPQTRRVLVAETVPSAVLLLLRDGAMLLSKLKVRTGRKDGGMGMRRALATTTTGQRLIDVNRRARARTQEQRQGARYRGFGTSVGTCGALVASCDLRPSHRVSETVCVALWLAVSPRGRNVTSLSVMRNAARRAVRGRSERKRCENDCCKKQ